MDKYPGYMFHRYYLQSVLGKGAYGAVYKAQDVFTGEIYAVKILDPSESSKEAYEYEVASHTILSDYPGCSEYVICLYDHGYYDMNEELSKDLFLAINSRGLSGKYIFPKNAYYLTSELMDGDLTSLMVELKGLSDRDIAVDPRSYAFTVLQMLMGVEYIHSKDMAHRDIKPANILFKISSKLGDKSITLENVFTDFDIAKTSLVVKYGDLGFACTDYGHREKMGNPNVRLCSSNKGSIFYLSPFLINLLKSGKKLDIFLAIAQKADLWALGITIWKLLYLDDPPFLEDVETLDDMSTKFSSTKQGDLDTMFLDYPLVTITDESIRETITSIIIGLLTLSALRRIKIQNAVAKASAIFKQE